MDKNYFYYVKKSEYTLRESWFDYSNNKDGEFYSVGIIQNDVAFFTDLVLIRIDFLLDPQINQFVGESVSLFEAFGTIGGIFEIFHISIGIFVGIHSQATFRQSILYALKISEKVD